MSLYNWRFLIHPCWWYSNDHDDNLRWWLQSPTAITMQRTHSNDNDLQWWLQSYSNDNDNKNNVSVIMTHSDMTMVCTSDYDPQGHNGLQKYARPNTTVCQRHSMHRPFKHYKYSEFHISTPFRTIIAVQWMSLAHKYFGPRGDFANRCELFDVSTIQTLQL